MSTFNQFNGAKVLITGHTGFKGAWLSAWLKKIGAEVIGIALEESNDLSHFNVASIAKGMKDYRLDIRDQKSLNEIILSEKPDFIFHLAAQSIVKKSYTNSIETWKTNLMGTVNILESLKKNKKKKLLL